MGPPGLVLRWSCSGKASRVLGIFKSNTIPHAWDAPSYYQSAVLAAKVIKDVFVMFVGKSLAVKVT